MTQNKYYLNYIYHQEHLSKERNPMKVGRLIPSVIALWGEVSQSCCTGTL